MVEPTLTPSKKMSIVRHSTENSHVVNPTSVYNYLPFGEEMNITSMETAYMFTGQEYEENTDLYNYRARMYTQRRGHFLAPEPQHPFHSPYVPKGQPKIARQFIAGNVLPVALSESRRDGTLQPRILSINLELLQVYRP